MSRDIGNLIRLPYSGEAMRARSATLMLDQGTLDPVGSNFSENFEAFTESVRQLSGQEVDELLHAMGIDASREAGGRGRDYSNDPKTNNLNEIIENCAFLKHCQEDAAILPEPHWYLMICILAREFGGPALIHELSKPYPTYSYGETQEKINHALLDQPGPITCQAVRKVYDCDSDCGVTCPAHLTRQKRNEGGYPPEINAKNLDLPKLTAQAWAAIVQANEPPKYFRHATGLVRLEHDPEKGWFPQILTENRMRHELARVGNWFAEGKNGRVPALPPKHVVEDLLADPDPPLEYLERMVGYPIFGKDGFLHRTEGYAVSTRCYYAKAGNLQIPAVADHPTSSHIARARERIEDLISDFPFVSASEKAHAVGLSILPYCRNMIDGPTPLHVLEATSPGSGKTLLVQALIFPAFGRVLPSMSEPGNPAEWSKKITSALLTSPNIILIDNVRRRLDSGDLASALTSTTWSDRILGRSEIVCIPVKSIWCATGNNILVSTELARRTVRIRLDAMTDQPWLRDSGEFRHKNLLQWAEQNRGELVWAALTLIQAWIAEGRPEPAGVRPLGMFESWSHVVGGILHVAGIKGFLENLQSFYSESDFEGSVLRAFVEAWWDEHRSTEVGVGDLFRLVLDGDIPLPLGKGNERSQKTRLGILLSQNRDRQFGPFRIVAGRVSHRAQLWALAVPHLEGVQQRQAPKDIKCIDCLDYEPNRQPNLFGKCRGPRPHDGNQTQAPQLPHECEGYKQRTRSQ